MRTETVVVNVALFLGVVLFFSFPAEAQNNTVCANAVPIVPDGGTYTVTFTATDQLRFYHFGGVGNSSYAIMSDNLASNDVDPLAGGVPFPTDSCGGATVPSTLLQVVSPTPIIGIGSIWTRRSIVLTANSDVFFAIRGSTGASARVRVEETTLFNPAWSTFGTFETFYSCTNTTNVALNATLKLFDTMGVEVASFEFTSVPSRGTVSRNTGPTSLDVPNSLNGSAVLMHNGPPGAFVCEAAIADFTTAPRVIQPVKFEPARQQR